MKLLIVVLFSFLFSSCTEIEIPKTIRLYERRDLLTGHTMYVFKSWAVHIESECKKCQKRSIKHGDERPNQLLSTDFNSSDLKKITTGMVDSMLKFPPLIELTSKRRPVISVSKIKNKTMQQIDLASLTDSIKTKLIQSGKFRFINRLTDQEAIAELKYQRDSGLVDLSTVQSFGEHVGAEYLLTGSFIEIVQESGSKKDVYYKITMNLKNIRTGIDEWAEEKEIQKNRNKYLIGRSQNAN